MLTKTEIKKQIEAGKISISNIKESNFKPNSYLVSIEDYLYTFNQPIIDTKDKINYYNEILTGHVDKLKKVKIPNSGLLLEPMKTYIAKIREEVTTDGYIPVLNGRNSLSLLGISIELNNGFYSSNHNGPLFATIVCTKPTIIYPRIKIGNLTFFKCTDEKSANYGMLSGKEIEKQMGLGNIQITPNDRILINPNSVNLTLYNSLAYYPDDIIDLKKENKIQTIPIDKDGIVLYPGQIYIATTNEYTKTNNYVPMLSGRSSIGRLGIHVHCSGGMGSIGYEGFWRLPLRVSSPVRVRPNMEISQIYFLTPDGDINDTYQGDKGLDRTNIGSKYYEKI